MKVQVPGKPMRKVPFFGGNCGCFKRVTLFEMNRNLLSRYPQTLKQILVFLVAKLSNVSSHILPTFGTVQVLEKSSSSVHTLTAEEPRS